MKIFITFAFLILFTPLINANMPNPTLGHCVKIVNAKDYNAKLRSVFFSYADTVDAKEIYERKDPPGQIVNETPLHNTTCLVEFIVPNTNTQAYSDISYIVVNDTRVYTDPVAIYGLNSSLNRLAGNFNRNSITYEKLLEITDDGNGNYSLKTIEEKGDPYPVRKKHLPNSTCFVIISVIIGVMGLIFILVLTGKKK